MTRRIFNIKSLGYSSLTIALLIPYSIIIGADIGFRFGLADLENDHWFTVMQIVIGFCFLVFCFLTLTVDRFLGRKKPIFWHIYRCGIVALLTAGIVLLLQDSQHYQPYTWDDVPQVSSENIASYKILESNLMRPDAKIEIANPGVLLQKASDDPITYESAILLSWAEAEDARQMIDALDNYAQIADLSTPQNAIDLNIMQFFFLSKLYRAYALLMVEKGQWAEAVTQLGRIHSVACKALPYARYFIHKLIWTSVAEGCIDTAYQISRHPNVTEDTLNRLLPAFPPLEKAATSFIGTLISEAMFMKDSFSDFNTPENIRNEICDSLRHSDLCDHWWNRALLTAFSRLCYKPQSTENHMHRYMHIFVEACRQHPPAIFQVRTELTTSNRPIFGNTMGWILLKASPFDFTYYPERLAKVKVLSDLFHLYLQNLLENEVVMKDYLCNGDYLPANEPGVFKSAGWDCIADTEDDIVFDIPSAAE